MNRAATTAALAALACIAATIISLFLAAALGPAWAITAGVLLLAAVALAITAIILDR